MSHRHKLQMSKFYSARNKTFLGGKDQGGSFKCVVNEGGPNTIPNAPTLLLSPYKAVWIYFTKKKI